MKFFAYLRGPRLGLALTLALTLALGGCAARDEDATQVESVVLIVVDTLRADHTGLYGYARPTSPNLDAWARRGVVFDNAFSTSPWTVPAFGSMLTGLLPSVHGAGWPSGDEIYDRSGMVRDVATLPLILGRSGFETGAIVSNPFLGVEFGFDRGFEAYSYELGRTADQVVDSTLRWIDARGGNRFFLMVHFVDPHLIYHAPEPFFGRFSEEEAFVPLPFTFPQLRLGAADLPQAVRERLIGRYDDEIAFLDHELGRLLSALEELDGTLVIFTADHGEELFDHDGFEHGHTMMQELLRVPLVIAGPGVVAQRTAEPVTLADIPLTVLEATGREAALSSESGMIGRSLWPLLREEPREANRRPGDTRQLFAETMLYGSERKALVEWPYKLILDPATGEIRLFDLEHDPGERDDLAPRHAEIVERLESALRQRLLASPPVVGPSEPPENETIDQLEALGYLN